jgi:hypothetical protein
MSKGQQAAAVPARVTQAVDPENRVTLRGNTHPLARPEFDQGAAPDGLATERMLLVLKRSTDQETALRELLDAQQTKSSPNYHVWLTPEEFGRQFGPADADIQAVTNWLSSQGFQVNRVAAGRTVIEFSGTAGAVRQALHTEIHKYMVNGEEHWANATDPQIPAALTPVVAGFASLNSFPRKPMHRQLGSYTKSKSTVQVKPLLTASSGGVTYYALGPADFAKIYNVPNWSAFTGGSGQTIAVVGQTNINPQDVDDFRTLFGIKPLSPAANSPCPAVSTTHPIPVGICVNGPDPGIADLQDEGEADLDVEWSGVAAPAATIAFVVSETTEVTAGIDLSALYIIDNNLAPIMTESYGECEAYLLSSGNAFYNALWEQGAAEGITILEAAGDQGSAACDVFEVTTSIGAAQSGLNVVGNASTPFNVAVGGTDFNDSSSFSTYWSSSNNSTTLSSAMSYIPEMAWNDTCANSGSLNGCSSGVSDTGSDLVGGGGGESNCSSSTSIVTVGGTEIECVAGYSKPSWQSGTGVPADGVRDLPDLSLFAGDGYANSFYVICEADALQAGSSSCVESGGSVNFLGVGGTSASVQAFGGIMALVNQKYGPQGVANYVLYPLAAKSGASCASTAAMAPTAGSSSCVFYDTQTGNNSVACVADSPNCSDQSTGGTGYGILVNPSNSAQAAWTTTAGYDMATGLGTVNAANLVSQWNTVTFTPTTTTLTITPPAGYTLSNIPHGQAVTVAVSVSPAASTGDVSLLGGPAGYNASCTSTPCNLGIDFATLSNGAASGSTTMLPGGTYDVTARYAGDGTHAASTSSPVKVTVAAENSETFLELATEDCSGNITYVTTGQFAYGNSISCSGVLYSQYRLVMNVTNGTGSANAANPGGVAGACFDSPAYQCPAGQVTVTLNGSSMPLTVDVGAPSGNTPGTYNLNSQGTAEDQFIQLPVGADSLVATYEPHPVSPNNSYNSSVSTAAGVTITKAATVTSVTPSQSTITSGETVTLTATVTTSSLGLAPTGTVTFLNGSNQISGTPTYTYAAGSYAGTASLTATLSTSFTANASITVTYSGDPNYTTSTSSAVTVTITATPDFGLSASPSSFTITSPGQSGSTTVSASAINGFTGTVSITCTLPSSMSYSTCTLTTSTLTPGGAGAQLTVATTAPSAALRLPNRPRWFLPGAGVLLFAWILLLFAAGKHRRVKLAFGLLVFAVLAASFVACGGGGGTTTQSNPGTPTGSYNVTLTGTSTINSATVTHTLNIPVAVQ